MLHYFPSQMKKGYFERLIRDKFLFSKLFREKDVKKLRVEIATLQKSEPKDNAPSAETEAVKYQLN